MIAEFLDSCRLHYENLSTQQNGAQRVVCPQTTVMKRTTKDHHKKRCRSYAKEVIEQELKDL